MGNGITPTAFAWLFVRVYTQLNRDAYVTHILGSTPRKGDTWQNEKFARFQAAAEALSRMSPEHIENVISYAIADGS